MIETIHLGKTFGSLKAVFDLNLQTRPGEIFGFLGPNGAGKTTTIKLITGLLRPTYGRVVVGGFDVAKNPVEAKRILAYVPDQPQLYGKLTVEEFLKFIGAVFGMDSKTCQEGIGNFLELFGFADKRRELIESLSHGTKQKVALAAAFLHEPKVLLLDEPLVGLDPRSARILKDLFREYAKRGATIFLSTHILEVAERMCDRVGIINKGELVAIGAAEELKSKTGREGESLEDLFLELTGGREEKELLKFLKENG
ncbi:MAG TPA: ABC transporter ATP-binding protein [candidate division Zixibacteria bacterium]|nr:ABC transporter ATP-binding protein [candidate division Zixibacteria bacterium]